MNNYFHQYKTLLEQNASLSSRLAAYESALQRIVDGDKRGESSATIAYNALRATDSAAVKERK